jgi:hypothetical protein
MIGLEQSPLRRLCGGEYGREEDEVSPLSLILRLHRKEARDYMQIITSLKPTLEWTRNSEHTDNQ